MDTYLFTFIILCAIVLTGCKKKTSEVIPEDQNVILDSLSSENISTTMLSLSMEAEKNISSFEDFKSLRNLLQTMKSSNPFYIKKYADSTDLLIQTFKENLEEGGGDINVNTIKSRIVVLSTESGLLMDLASGQNPSPQSLMDANSRLITAYNSLVIQLNELSLAIPETIEKELLKDSAPKRDSVQNFGKKKSQ